MEAICRAREGHNFRGRDAVLCLGAGNLFVQNLRVTPAEGDELAKIVHFEAAGRLPFASEEAEIRYLEADDVRQGDTIRREVILLACYRPALDRMLEVVERAGMRAAAIDVEPAAVLRCYSYPSRREEDLRRRIMLLNIGAANTVAVIARGTDPVFIKYLDVGGRQCDEAVGKRLKMSVADASALRRHNDNCRPDDRDPEVVRSLAEAMRPVLDKLAHELSLCLRYYRVTFRGQPLNEMVLSGGEATEALAQLLSAQLDIPCRLGNPLRPFGNAPNGGRAAQWDVAAGLALRDGNDAAGG